MTQNFNWQLIKYLECEIWILLFILIACISASNDITDAMTKFNLVSEYDNISNSPTLLSDTNLIPTN